MHLLVSVRSAGEAEAALAGEASLIDVKEPRRGPLGRADDAVLGAVFRAVTGRAPVSAALGELLEAAAVAPIPVPLAYVKWGLAGATGVDWRRAFLERMASLAQGVAGPAAVVAAYADATAAKAPPVGEVLDFARGPGGPRVLLLDTFTKGPDASGRRRTLLDWLSVREVTALCQRCREAGVRVALAGSLGPEEVLRLLPARPDWFAVRGAACAGHDREQAVLTERVRTLVDLLS